MDDKKKDSIFKSDAALYEEIREKKSEDIETLSFEYGAEKSKFLHDKIFFLLSSRRRVHMSYSGSIYSTQVLLILHDLYSEFDSDYLSCYFSLSHQFMKDKSERETIECIIERAKLQKKLTKMVDDLNSTFLDWKKTYHPHKPILNGW